MLFLLDSLLASRCISCICLVAEDFAVFAAAVVGSLTVLRSRALAPGDTKVLLSFACEVAVAICDLSVTVVLYVKNGVLTIVSSFFVRAVSIIVLMSLAYLEKS